MSGGNVPRIALWMISGASMVRCRATRVPISAKLGTESRFWAFGGVQQKRENY